MSMGTWCSGITPAQHAGGPGLNPQRVQTHTAMGNSQKSLSILSRCTQASCLIMSCKCNKCQQKLVFVMYML